MPNNNRTRPVVARSRMAQGRRNAIPNLSSRAIHPHHTQELRRRFRNLAMSSPVSEAANTSHGPGSRFHSGFHSDADSDADSDPCSPTSPWRPLYSSSNNSNNSNNNNNNNSNNNNNNNNNTTTTPTPTTDDEEDAASAIERDFRAILATSVAHAGGRHDAVHGILRASLQALTLEAVESGVTAPSGPAPVPWTFVMHAASVNLVRFSLLSSNRPFPARAVYGQRLIPLRPPFVNWGLLAFTVSVSSDLVVGLPRLIASQYSLCPCVHEELVELDHDGIRR
ncbi:hypothetical protein SODALDRAFT_75492 [Sodiomyces alkalinus F11]|uniref:Uncharacterized protein n=1 Tax=Sodiomyces alkalinus (strain CBS 110278 / VKM F-3762 / F11) TaxID=1314773 RepID=A0A3N2PKD9_SODAK|nr:hypothetical protein SODALDRAFT_75492 [Sodiomyces alkalinus F11]ROT34983.1 hypothetical protein SODALDRAFT_75492 [Sodiomyces alkalinus F11]